MGTNTIVLKQGQLDLQAGTGTTTIDGGRQVAVYGNGASGDFLCDSGAHVSLTGLAILGGHAAAGAGIENVGGSLALSNVTLSGNAGQWGGAVYNSGTLTVSNATFSGNSAFYYGGGIDNIGSLIVTDSTVSCNTAQNGGGIMSAASTTLVNSIVAGNSNTASGTGPDVDGGLSLGSAYDLIGNGSGMTGLC
jgi:hypothetical protein